MEMRKIVIGYCLLCSLAAMAQSTSRKMEYVEADNHNQKIINRYNKCHKNHNMYVEPELAKDFTAIFGVRDNSIMSNKDIEVSIVKKRIGNPIYNDKEDRVYYVQIKNKTNKTLYIDRGYCFRIDSDGSKYRYYNSGNRVDSLYRERVIAIPPHAKKNLTDYHCIKDPQANYPEIVEYPEEFLWNMEAVGISKGYVHYGESRQFTEKNSPFYRTFVIYYSKEKDLSTYSLALVNCYIKEIIGYYYPETYEYDILSTHIVGDDKYSITSWLPLY